MLIIVGGLVMNIPEKVKILYKEYTVEEQENLHDGGKELYGQIYYLSEKIMLNTNSFPIKKQKRVPPSS